MFIEFLDRFVAGGGGGIVRLIRVVSLTFDLVRAIFSRIVGEQRERKFEFYSSKGMVSAIKSSTNSSDFNRRPRSLNRGSQPKFSTLD